MSANPVLEQATFARSGASAREHTAELYECYYERVFGYCLYKLGDRQEAEDAAQTTFLWVMRGLERGIEPRLEANWLFTIAQNACRARIKTRGRKREQETLSDPHILERVAPGRPAVDDELVGLHEALRDMPDLQRQAIILREWRGFSYKEIAAELDLSDAAVETLIFRARRSLATRLENPTARPAARARSFAINLGSLGSAFKSLLGMGGAAKLGALLATVGALAIGVGIEGDSPARALPALTPPAAPLTQAAPHRQAPHADQSGKTTGRKHHRQTPAASGSVGESTSPGANGPSAASPTVQDTVEHAAQTLPTATDAVDTVGGVSGSLGDSVDDVLGSVDKVLDHAAEQPVPALP
jgi:RNA polymerase sigma factor (sigma-70 family)